MASTTFTKRQKERARQEKQRMKAERRQERKRNRPDAPAGGPPIDFEFNALEQTEATTPEENDGGERAR